MMRIIIIFLTLISTFSFSKPLLFPANVLGRDLQVPIIGLVGHIGIWTENTVLEVMNEPQVIQENTFEDFLSRSYYWGRTAATPFTNNDKNNIIRMARGQKGFNPKYNINSRASRFGKFVTRVVWDKRKKEYVRTTTKIQAILRCDTFVKFAYNSTSPYYYSRLDGFIPKTVFDNVSKIKQLH